MKQENKKSKKKILLYYLILAACLLVIAAVTVTVIFTVRRNKTPISAGTEITNPDNNKGNEDDNKDNQGNNDNNPDKPDDGKDNKPTTNVKGYVLPIRTANVTNAYDFLYDVTLDRYCVHQGMDFKGKTGDEVCAVLDGTVTKIVKDDILDGSYITLSHAGGVITTYKYIEAKENLNVGSTVKQGDVIGVIAAANGSEMKQGEHLHFEMKVNGKQANPNDYLDIIEK